jgi:putative transposase
MSHNYYSEVNLHVTWHTKDSLPLLTPQVRDMVYRCLRQRLVNAGGVFVHEAQPGVNAGPNTASRKRP